MTSRQAQYMEFMRKFFADNDQLPTVDALACGMGVTPNAADETLKRLNRDGHIQRNSLNKWMFAR